MNAPIYVGIDQAVGGFGLSILCPDGEWHDTTVKAFPLNKHGDQGVVQLGAVEDWLYDNLISVYDRVAHVVMEGYSHGSPFGREKAGELGYAVKRTLYRWLPEHASVPTVVAPTQVKEFATGNGGASKQDVINSVAGLWGVEFKNDNAADAYVMARIAYALDTGFIAAEYQVDVLQRIKNPKLKKRRVRQTVTV